MAPAPPYCWTKPWKIGRVDLIEAEEIRRQVTPELGVVAGFDDEAPGQLPLHVQRPRVVLGQAARVVRLPVGDVAAVQRLRHQERRLRPRRPAGVPVERGARREGRRGHVVAADEALPVRAAAGVLHRAEDARRAEPHDGLVVEAVDGAEARAEAPRPGVVHRLLAGAACALAGELRRAQVPAGGRIGQIRVEVRVAIREMALPRRRRVLVAHAVVDGQLVVDPPVVLEVRRSSSATDPRRSGWS